MSYKVEISIEEKYLQAKVSGKRDSEREALDALRVIDEISKICKTLDLKKILIFWNVPGKVNKEQIFLLMQQLEEYSWGKEMRIATVHQDEDNYRSNSFSKAIANQLGWSLNLFNQEEAAITWLLKEEKDQLVDQ